MDALTSFIVVIIAITIQFSLYAIKRLQEPLEPNYLIDKNSKKRKNYMGRFWKNAEITNWEISYDWVFSFNNKLWFFWVDSSRVYLSD
tara:strand:+ start:607 stop:870 length:264 start_codon:yes stop_codon:yes gene_type:complete